MSESQRYTNKEVKKLLRSVCLAIWGNDLPAGDVWIDSEYAGQKKEPYVVIAGSDRRSWGPDDSRSYHWVAGATESDPFTATETTVRDRRVALSVLVFGSQGEDLAQKVSDNLRGSQFNEMFWAKGVGLVSHSEPVELPMNEGNKRRSFYRVSVVLSVSEVKSVETNYIQYVEISSPQLGIPEQVIELPTPGGP